MNRKKASQLTALPLVSKPPVESFFDPEQATAVWPKHITARPDFRAQTQAQQAILHAVQTIFANLPIGTTLAEGLAKGLVTEVSASNLLNRLSQYLKADRVYERIIFYLPFELTSPIASETAALNLASKRFQKAYRVAWESQARQYDVRANFVDGDVLEVEKRNGDLLRVVKATHLIPGLIESGHMTLAEVTAYARSSSDPLLRHGIQEACAVIKSPKITEEAAVSAEDIRITLLANITEASCLEDRAVTPNRLRWLRQRAHDRAITAAARRLSSSLIWGAPLPNPETLDQDTKQSYVEAIRLSMLQKNQLGKKYRAWLTAVARTPWCTDAVYDAITKVYRHAYTAGILEEKVALAHRIQIPMLQGPFSKNLDNFAPSVAEFREMVAQISSDAYLATRVYPVAILFGSQLKGYGADNSDADVAVFIKPGTTAGDPSEIASRLRGIFAHERIGGSAIMFWLDRRDGSLVVRENTETTGMPPLNSWTHVLMGGAWIGDETCITTLQHELLVPYLFNPTITLDGKPIRERWLEEMERDSILYRLLHKGFERYYPICSPLDTAHSSAVDGTSAFYDPTFRRIATLLFLTRVFFPKLDL